MYKNNHIVVTGGFGLIGSALVKFLNSKGITPFILERKDRIGEKWRNVIGLSFTLVDKIPHLGFPSTIIDLAANVDTTAPMTSELWENNFERPLKLLDTQRECNYGNPRFIYASTAALYGNEEKRFTERLDVKPMNAYAFTKLQLDCALKDKQNVYGLRFFNVFGENETHKGNMKSVVGRAMDIKNGVFEIFKTGREDIKDGEQARDFIFTEDICRVIWHFITTEDNTGGLFNVGTGRATSFNEIADALNLRKEYIDMPTSVKNQYQFYTCADITKLRSHGYKEPFLTVTEGIVKIRANRQDNSV